MYNYKSEEFGKFLKYSFYNDKTGNTFSVVPECGACLLDVFFEGLSIIDGCQTIEELLKNDWYKSAFLFPFPNRLKNGKYNFAGKLYQFPINDIVNNNSIHGFGPNQVFKIVSIKCDENGAEIHCRHENQGVNPAYPFPFYFEVKMRISEPDSFTIELTFKNESQQITPVGLGWHPYFHCFDKVDLVFMQMPDCQFVEVDESAISTGERSDYEYFKNKRQIENVVLDNSFELKNQKDRVEVVLFSNKGKLTYWQETGFRKFNFLQIFTPLHRHSIAIEPMTCNIDAFNNGEGLIVLQPGEQFSGQFGFTFQTL
jgi:aldose 1-epimerase